MSQTTLPLWDQLNRRLDAQFAHVNARLDDLHGALHTLQHDFHNRLDRHEDYHRDNEHHWGPERLAQRHPFRTALATAGAAACLVCLLLNLTPESVGLLAHLLRAATSILH
jgi:hypothetical protein